MVKLYFYPLEIISKTKAERTNIELYGKTLDNDQICVIDKNIKPYFYVIPKGEKTIPKLKKLQILIREKTIKIVSLETEERNYLGEKVKAIKLMMNRLIWVS